MRENVISLKLMRENVISLKLMSYYFKKCY